METEADTELEKVALIADSTISDRSPSTVEELSLYNNYWD